MSTPNEKTSLEQATALSVEALVRGARWSKRAIITLCAIVVVLAGVVGVGAWNVHRTTQIADQVTHGAYQSCLSGNKARAANRQIWDNFLNAILADTPHPTPAAVAFVHQQIAYINVHEKSQKCAVLYPSH